jgi:hypothetical protein
MNAGMSVEVITTFKCPICGTVYDKKEDAEKCLSKGTEKPIFRIGDIVTIGKDYGWFDGDERWVVEPEIAKDWIAKNRPMPNFKSIMHFYYVVSAIDVDDSDYAKTIHRARYHLKTKAMTGEQGHIGGFTFGKGHYTPKKVENPPECVVKDSKDLIGKKSEYLL